MSAQPAFSAVARHYDADFTDTAVGRLQRERVWHWLAKNLLGTPAVLELNCGTGADALWMVQRGCQVLATDISPEMVRLANEKIAQAGLSEKASARVCSFADIGQLPEDTFDLIFSNFGGLNCVSPSELERLGEVLNAKLKPGGQFIAVVMGRFCWWETLYFLLKRAPSKAFRRLRPGPVEARLDADTTVPTWYYSPAVFRRAFAQFSFNTIQPIGLWLPPSYLDPFFAKRPGLLRTLNMLENNWAPAWLTSAADHYFIKLVKHKVKSN
jgi:SAM-dependent methyltransferase